MCPYTANQQLSTQDPRRGTWVQVKETDSPGPETARTACEGPPGPDEGIETPTSQVHFWTPSFCVRPNTSCSTLLTQGRRCHWLCIFKNWNQCEIKKIPELGLSEGFPSLLPSNNSSRGKIQASAVTEKSSGTRSKLSAAETGRILELQLRVTRPCQLISGVRQQTGTPVWTHGS